MIEITKSEREKLLKQAYKNGYNYFQYVWVEEIEDNEHLSMLVNETTGNNSLNQTYRQIEDYFGFERGKHDWNNFGIYGIIEDSWVCYEKGAKDAIEEKECNPDTVSHMWDY